MRRAGVFRQRIEPMQFNLPTCLTLFRLLLVPVVALFLFLPFFPGQNLLTTATFGLALLTDWLDGWLARRWDQTSNFGAFLDPVADKLIVCAVLVLLVYRDPHVAVALPATVIIGRELTVSALREWMAELGQRGVVAVGAAGKYKTSIQMIAILVMLYALPTQGRLYGFGVTLLAVAALLTLWSMIMYLHAAWPQLRNAPPPSGGPS